MKRSPVALVAVPLALSILLSGCSGDAKPVASPSSTAISSPTTTAPRTTAAPTTDPNIPAAARAHTPAGAEAFVRYFFQRLNLAWTGPRAGILTPLCQTSAVACTEFEKEAGRLVKEGHHYDGNPVVVESVGVVDAPSANKIDVLANVIQERRSEIDAGGKTVVTDKRKNVRLHFLLFYGDQSWSISSMKVVQ